ncbi:MAG: HlyD family secretion protein [Acidobacteriaceae bacterium]
MAESRPEEAQQQPQEHAENNRAAEETELHPRGSHSRKRFFIIGGVVLVVIVALLYWWHSTYYESTDDAQVDGNLVQISARIKGNITKVGVSDNEQVEKGQVLVEIDPRDAQATLSQGEANLASAKANYEAALVSVPITVRSTGATLSGAGADVRAALSTIAQSEKQLDAAQAQVLAAEAQNTKAQLDLKRYTPLVQRDVVSKLQYDAVVATASSMQAQLAGAKANLEGAQAQVRVANDRLATARANYNSAGTGPKQVAAQRAKADAAAAQVQQAQAALEVDRLNLSYTRIVAPESGIVNQKTAQVGQNVSAGQTVMTLIPLTGLWITANFKETQLDHMRRGQPVTVKADAYGGRVYHATVTQIGGATGSMLSLFPPENATGNYVKVVQRIPVRLDFTDPNENKDNLLRPGMSVTPKVRVKN